MKIMLDTNILISAVLFPDGTAARAYKKANMPPFEPIVCDYIVEELKRKFTQKFPDRISALKSFLSTARLRIVVVPTLETQKPEERLIRDVKDRQILRAAISSNADLLLTGDKDFLEASIENPQIVSVAQFLQM